MNTGQTLALLVPAYNAASHLPRLLESASWQKRPFDELWVYDDCSTDETAAVAARYGARVVKGEINRGCSHGKNRLAEKTKCDWIRFNDADDELLPDFTERAHIWMADDRLDVVLFAFEERDDPGGELLGRGCFNAPELSNDARGYVIRNQVSNFGIYRRQSFLGAGGYDEDPLVLFNEDVAFHIRLAFQGLSFAADPTLTFINHRRGDSMSARNQLRCLQAQYNVLRKTAVLAGAERYRIDLARRLWMVVGGLAAYLDWRTADQAASLAIDLAGPAGLPNRGLFRALCRASPHLALRAREWLIRAFKPALREGYPSRAAAVR